MIKYLNYSVTFQEVPDEISLCFNITNCQFACKGCHSPELRKDIGSDLEKDLIDLIRKYYGAITCVCFLGEGNDPEALLRCLRMVRNFSKGLKICLYSGSDRVIKKNGDNTIGICITDGLIDYLKLGPYIEKYGGLSNPNTNQTMYFFKNGFEEDITYKFWRKKV